MGQGGRSPGGRPGPGKIWEVEVEGGDTAAIHFDPHYLAWEGGDSIDSHYRGLGKALGKSWKPDAVKALKTLSGFTPGARTIHLLEIPEEQIRF